MLAGSIVLSVVAGLVALIASLALGNPLIVALLTYSLVGSLTLLAIGFRAALRNDGS